MKIDIIEGNKYYLIDNINYQYTNHNDDGGRTYKYFTRTYGFMVIIIYSVKYLNDNFMQILFRNNDDSSTQCNCEMLFYDDRLFTIPKELITIGGLNNGKNNIIYPISVLPDILFKCTDEIQKFMKKINECNVRYTKRHFKLNEELQIILRASRISAKELDAYDKEIKDYLIE